MNNGDHIIRQHVTVKEALKQLDIVSVDKALVIVDDDNKLLGTLTDGDLRRYLLSGKGIDDLIDGAFHSEPLFLKASFYSADIVKLMMIEKQISILPILDDNNHVIEIIKRSQLFHEGMIGASYLGTVDVPMVVMAGGKGTRMEPFTKILPKPLIPISDTPILEVIMDEFNKQGVKTFYVTLNYRGEMIQTYFKDIEKPYDINYVWEKDFYGTAGCLKLLADSIQSTFIVSNCDVIVKADYSDVLKHHYDQQAAITILSSIQHYKIPYGIIEYSEGGVVDDIKEKPEYSFNINTGLYILNRDVLDLIPHETVYHMTHLINDVIQNGGRVVTYPVNENEYLDIGQWDEYKKAMDKLAILR